MDCHYYIFYLGFFFVAFTGAHSKAAYNGLMAKIELFNELLCFGFSLSMAIILLGVIPYTFVRYFIYDMGENSFYLFAPTWFVFVSKIGICVTESINYS